MDNKKVNYNELQEACKTLGLDASEFIDTQEIQKGGDSINYKLLYQQQLENNQKLILMVGATHQSISNNFEEVKKGVIYLQDSLNQMGNSPLHQQKSFVGNVKIVEKAFGGEEQKSQVNASFSISQQLKQVKSYLGAKMMMDLQKGVSNGAFERAAMQLDANGFIENGLVKQILDSDKVLITA